MLIFFCTFDFIKLRYLTMADYVNYLMICTVNSNQLRSKRIPGVYVLPAAKSPLSKLSFYKILFLLMCCDLHLFLDFSTQSFSGLKKTDNHCTTLLAPWFWPFIQILFYLIFSYGIMFDYIYSHNCFIPMQFLWILFYCEFCRTQINQ